MLQNICDHFWYLDTRPTQPNRASPWSNKNICIYIYTHTSSRLSRLSFYITSITSLLLHFLFLIIKPVAQHEAQKVGRATSPAESWPHSASRTTPVGTTTTCLCLMHVYSYVLSIYPYIYTCNLYM